MTPEDHDHLTESIMTLQNALLAQAQDIQELREVCERVLRRLDEISSHLVI